MAQSPNPGYNLHPMNDEALGALAVREGFLTPTQLKRALEACNGQRLDGTLIRLGILTPQKVRALHDIRRILAAEEDAPARRTRNPPSRCATTGSPVPPSDRTRCSRRSTGAPRASSSAPSTRTWTAPSPSRSSANPASWIPNSAAASTRNRSLPRACATRISSGSSRAGRSRELSFWRWSTSRA